MKREFAYHHIVIICVCLISVVLIACNASKDKMATEHALLIELSENENESYLYDKYDMEGVKRANKTLNQYLCKLKLSQDKYQKLISKLEDDPKVVKVTEPTTKPGNPSQSTNVGRSTTKPIKQ
ncbi:MAG: hypothetical protein AAGK97_15830 [Bacteroidota bacterium]